MSNDNKSAFPHPLIQRSQGGSIEPTIGMTLREYFAGLAMIGMLGIGGPRGHIDGKVDETAITALAVKYADALLAELDK